MAQHSRIVAEIDLQSLVKDVEGAFPQSVVLEGLAVSHDATVDLVHLVETAILHDDGQHFTTNSTGAIGDDRLVLEVIVFSALQLLDKIRCGADIRNDGILETTDTSLEFVATIEEDNVITSFLHQIVHFCR